MNEPIGLRHFALMVDGKLEDEVARLKAVFHSAGFDVEFGTIMEDWTGVRFCFMKDFDGINIELRECSKAE